MYGNAQKLILKGGAAWFLGIKYYSEDDNLTLWLLVAKAHEPELLWRQHGQFLRTRWPSPPLRQGKPYRNSFRVCASLDRKRPGAKTDAKPFEVAGR
jgi:hypothetical protein